MNPRFWLREEAYVLLTAFVAALLIAATEMPQSGVAGFFGGYAYWIIRILIEAFMFFGMRQILETFLPKTFPKPFLIALAILISLLPFVLAITAIDIVLGFPELGIGTGVEEGGSRLSAFGWELVYLLDNHIALGVLLTIPSIIFARIGISTETALSAGVDKNVGTLLAALEPPLDGAVIWMEAQEHYVRVTTSNETRMVLSRFSDLVRELPETRGIQVHRSHWVAFSEIDAFSKEGQSTNLKLKSGAVVPVSRSFRNGVKSHLERMAAL